jgi:hypothetical protein
MGTEVTLHDITGFLNDQGVAYSVSEDSHVRSSAETAHGGLHLLILLDDSPAFMTILAAYPFAVPVERRADIALALAGLNYGLRFGSFEMDLQDGELRFRVSYPAAGVGFIQGHFQGALATAILTAERCYPTVQGILELGEPAEPPESQEPSPGTPGNGEETPCPS